ncbi:Zn-dependent carboxypeptidase [Longilinea arvoryzae]|uniref:Metal-dependent carboxypeptidase n=1 Tax=Longilinea arvoryzae TaxID=360412 RepID=A0A0S7BLM5_9CHLR|nr:carboxypeptidase M32 [Longilinea arvoryzae]GAP15571.1 Zn-dependent carboxypeptidase [Longilinea arvoryzae]
MQPQLDQLKKILNEVADLSAATSVLSWDQQTYMPEGGSEDRGDALATLSGLAHTRFTSEEVGKLLDDLSTGIDQLNPDSDEARLIKVTRHNYEKNTRVPSEKVAEFARVTTVAQSVWARARAENNYALFMPHLKKIIELRQEYAGLFTPYDHIYDPLLDDYEPGLKTADVQAIFNVLRPQQVALLQAIHERPQVNDNFLRQKFDEEKQWHFGVDVITRFGYDWKRGRQDRSAHPFTIAFGTGDVRITTRFEPEYGGSALFSTMHECGHALYEQGVNPAYRRTPLSGGASMAIHESQSRLWENLVGRSLPFWKYFYPKFQRTFPEILGNVDLMTFYKGINKVEPSFIRTESDEATYNLHIMLRLELEIALIEGSLDVKDLPEAWNERMHEYLGITPPNNKVGVLQDVHWAGGMFGYFPTYALGNLVSVQLWECIQRDLPNLDDQLARGEFSQLLAWLRKNVHVYGSKYEPQELVQKITGSRINPQPYIRYLQTKYGEIYQL